MNELLHPGLILICAGLVVFWLPKNLRRCLMLLGPLAAVYAAFQLQPGLDCTLDFVYGYRLHYLLTDKLSIIFTLVFAIMALIGCIYSLHNESRMEAMCSMAYAGGAIGVTLAGDWLTLIFFWESMAVTSLFLIWCSYTPASRRAGFRYLLVHLLGGNLLLAGVFFKLSAGDIMVGNLAAGAHDFAFWLILLGVAVNTAIPPLHGWLPDAYPEGTITGSVFLSSFTTKVAVYCMIRIFAGTAFLMWLGAFMALYGACYAIMENDMRRLLSYHIISQVGFMVAAVGVGTAMSLNGAAILAHGNILYKSLLFMCAGCIIYATGIKKINQLGGMAKKLPFVTVCFFIAALAISGVPPFNGFVSKPIAIDSALLAGQASLYQVLELASIGTFLSITLKMGYFIFLRQDPGIKLAVTLPKNMYAAMGLGAALCCLYGVCPDLLYSYLPYATDPYVPYTLAHILQHVEVPLIATVPFMMYLSRMEPHVALSLDTDWFYRRPFAAVVKGCSYLFCALCSALGGVWNVLYHTFMELTANPMKLLDARPFRHRKKYSPENYRTSIADPMMVTLTVLTCVIGYLLASL